MTSPHLIRPADQNVRIAPRQANVVPRRLRRYLSLDDFQHVAERRLPRQIYGYYAGYAETGTAYRHNEASFRDIALVPRVLNDTRARTTTTSLFGHAYDLPVGIAPMGLSGLSTFHGDLVLGRAAKRANALMVTSATSLARLERIHAETRSTWFQAYLPGDRDRILPMLERVRTAGYDTLALTVDVPVAANRENNVRTGFSMPLVPTPRLLWDGLTHPRWSIGTFLRTLMHGMPHFENMDAGRGPAILSRNVVRDIGVRDALAWEHVALIRKHWHGNFVLKGVLSGDDVAMAREHGVDGVWLSNHGGRQLDGAATPLSVLPDAVEHAGSMAVLMDGGFRRGTDVMKALALGADFVFVGRPFLFAAACAGEDGVRHAFALLQAELSRDMAMMGITDLDQLEPRHVRPAAVDLGIMHRAAG